MNEDKPRKLVYVEKHTEPSQIWDHSIDTWYECPECGRRYTWLGRSYGNRGISDKYCSCCGNYLSWAKLDLENHKESDKDFDKSMPLWQFLQEPRYGHTWEHEVSMTYSHSEKDILKGCIDLMRWLVKDFQDYCEYMDWKPDTEEERFRLSVPYSKIVKRLFLWNTKHSGGTSTGMKCMNLGIEEYDVIFEFDKEDEE